MSLRGKCGKICVELKPLGRGQGVEMVFDWVSGDFKIRATNDSNDKTVLAKQVSLSWVHAVTSEHTAMDRSQPQC